MQQQYIGIDLHSDRFTCSFERGGAISYKLEESDLELFYKELDQNTHVILEATTNSFEFYDRIKDKVKSVRIVNPNKMKIINETSKKTDRVDAKKLRKFLKYEVESGEDFLPKVYVPKEKIRELRGLFTTYKLYKKQIVQQKNRIYSIIRESLQGRYYKKGEIGNKGIKEKVIRDRRIKRIYREQIEIIYKTIEMLKEEEKVIKEKILWEGREYKEEIEILTSILGISAFIALGIISDYGEIGRFKNGRHFSSYLRSVPRVDSSNKSTYIGKTKKEGRSLSISLITQSLYHIVKSVEVPIGRYYRKKQEGKSKGKVRMAVIRKMLVTMYYMLKNKEYYRYRIKERHERKIREYESFLKKYEKKLKIS